MGFDSTMWGAPERGTGTGTNAGVTVTLAASGNQTHAITGITTSSDAACVVTIESPAGTVLWRKRFAAAHADTPPLGLTPIMGAPGQATLVKVSASTAACEASIVGQLI